MPSFTHAELLRLTDAETFARGVECIPRVDWSATGSGSVRAFVRTDRSYPAELLPEHGDLLWYCDCRRARQGRFCEHCVALGLVHLFDTDPGEIEHASQTEELALVERTLQVDDERAHQMDSAYGHRVEALAVYLWRQALWASPGRAVHLLRHTLSLMARNAKRMDVLDFRLLDAGDQLAQTHLLSCRRALPEPRDLGRWLLSIHLSRALWLVLPLEDYVPLLGAEGLEEYRQGLFT